ncbi:AfsR/SARP family transcriptional regulator [Modestobacter excelsi]|uniref:AfsR/SARP family transcriptional regulator n=1 Tax=Modestobacter excelsi TaxID=2213161 RepID=UPI00110D1E21|nr:BTAD domain-containing putative transcriptional regulator [Modestobacter excelsi]
MPVRICLLGPVAVVDDDGRPVDVGGPRARALLARLRRTPPEAPLRAQAHGYLLDVPAGAVDVHRFETLVARARREHGPERVVALLREAEALWRGPVLADLRTLAFAGPLATRWSDLRLTAAELRLAAELDLGQAGAVLVELEELVADGPLTPADGR